MPSNELFYTEQGKKQDASLHDTLLDNRGVDNELSKQAIERAIKRGVAPDVAASMYKVR